MDKVELTSTQRTWLESRKALKLTKAKIDESIVAIELLIRECESQLGHRFKYKRGQKATIRNSLAFHQESLRIFKELKPIDQPVEVTQDENE